MGSWARQESPVLPHPSHSCPTQGASPAPHLVSAIATQQSVRPGKEWLLYLSLGPHTQESQPLSLHSQHIGAMQATTLSGFSPLHGYPELGSWKEYTVRLAPGQDWGGGREQVVQAYT